MPRPSLKDGLSRRGVSPVVTFRLPPDDEDWLNQYCAANKVTKASVLQKLFYSFKRKQAKKQVAGGTQIPKAG